MIKKKDYEAFLPEDLKEDLYILDRYYVWKRRIRLGRHLDGLSNNIRELFQNELYIVSNRK